MKIQKNVLAGTALWGGSGCDHIAQQQGAKPTAMCQIPALLFFLEGHNSVPSSPNPTRVPLPGAPWEEQV